MFSRKPGRARMVIFSLVGHRCVIFRLGCRFGMAFRSRWAICAALGGTVRSRFLEPSNVRRENAIISETRGHTGVPHFLVSLLTGMGQSTSTGSTGAILSGVFSAVETTGANSLSSNASFG